MKVMYSPIISQASGAAGPVVASRWKGINFMRERVIPANPRTADQVAVRGLMARATAWWHDLPALMKAYCDVLAQGLPQSGFNAFAKRNVRDLYTWLTTLAQPVPTNVPPRIMPLNSPVNPIAPDLAALTDDPGQIECTWTAGDAVGTHHVHFLVGSVSAATPGVFPNNLFLGDTGIVPVSEGSGVIPELTPGGHYMVAALVRDGDDRYSIGRLAWGTAGAA
jgi:hypothetical protein